MEIIQRGAEAVLYLSEQKELVKERVKKGYRIPELDSRIRSRRTRQEAELLSRARRAGVNTPQTLEVSVNSITMEWIEGRRVKDWLNKMGKKERMEVYSLIGEAVGKLHSAGIIHGDLTTSNMILTKGTTHGKARQLTRNEQSCPSLGRLKPIEKSRLFLIDFGLGKFSKKVEDQAVDLYLLFEALRSTHFQHLEEAWTNVLKAYKQNYLISNQIIQRIEKIRKRRRYA